MGNSKEKIDANEFYTSLEKLIVPLEYLARKFYNLQLHLLVYNSNKYKQIYENMTKNDLINKIIEGHKEFEKNVKIILNSNEFDLHSLFNDKEIKFYLNNILLWKQCCPEYKQIYDKIEILFIDIQKKYYESDNNNTNSFQGNIYINNEEECKNSNNEFIHNNNNQEQFQQQVLVNKQQVIQAQELALLNDNFGRALASLECFANRYSGQIISNVFGYYDMFNLGNTQDLVELQKKAFLQTQIFKLAYEDYVRNYGKYDVPENINIEEIKSLLRKWVEKIPNEFKIMYQGMLSTISSLNNDTFNQQFKSYSEQAKNAKMDPKKIMSFAPAVYYYNQQRCEEAKNQCLEEGKITSALNINQTYKDDKKAEQLEQQILVNNQLYAEDAEYKDMK